MPCCLIKDNEYNEAWCGKYKLKNDISYVIKDVTCRECFQALVLIGEVASLKLKEEPQCPISM